MANELVRKLERSLAVGSLKDLVRVRQDAHPVLLLDVSGSMGDYMHNHKRRIDGLRQTVASIQGEKTLQMVQFGHGHESSFIQSIPEPSGGTPLHLAIDFAKNNQANRVIVISDGQPDSQGLAMESAARFGGRIDVVFVGNPGERGEAFLKELAASTGGESFTGDMTAPKELAQAVIGLLTNGDDDDE